MARTLPPPDPDDPRPMWERLVAGDLYRGGVDPRTAEEAARGRANEDAFNATPDEPVARRAALEALFASVGEDTFVRPPIRCDFGFHTTIGSHSFVNTGMVALDVAPITIGDHVQIGPNVQLLTPTHPIDPDLRRAGWEAAEPIVIEDNVWIGGGAIVLAGVTVGADSVVGAGAVVTRDVPPGVVVVGNPARVIRSVR
jgi:maltose O-acetyltransferase